MASFHLPVAQCESVILTVSVGVFVRAPVKYYVLGPRVSSSAGSSLYSYNMVCILVCIVYDRGGP